VVSTVTGEAVALADSTAAAVAVFLVVVVGIVAVVDLVVSVVAEGVGVVVDSVDFAAAVVSADGGRTEYRVTRVEWRMTSGRHFNLKERSKSSRKMPPTKNGDFAVTTIKILRDLRRSPW
jgi:hypothetical protein